MSKPVVCVKSSAMRAVWLSRSTKLGTFSWLSMLEAVRLGGVMFETEVDVGEGECEPTLMFVVCG